MKPLVCIHQNYGEIKREMHHTFYVVWVDFLHINTICRVNCPGLSWDIRLIRDWV